MSVDLEAVDRCACRLEHVLIGVEGDPQYLDSRLYQELAEEAREALDLLDQVLRTPVTTKGD